MFYHHFLPKKPFHATLSNLNKLASQSKQIPKKRKKIFSGNNYCHESILWKGSGSSSRRRRRRRRKIVNKGNRNEIFIQLLVKKNSTFCIKISCQKFSSPAMEAQWLYCVSHGIIDSSQCPLIYESFVEKRQIGCFLYIFLET